MRSVKRCKKCILPIDFPHIAFDRRGICNFCNSYEGKTKNAALRMEYKKKFGALLKELAGKNTYDILACYSGGKDSTYTLSILKNIYRLKILAFTLDNGFVPARTYENMRNVVEKLEIDHMIFKPDFGVLKKIFKEAAEKQLYPPKTLERASTICTTCMGLVKYTAIKLAVEKEIPLIGFGWSPGQAPVTSSILKIDPKMIKGMENVIKRPLREIAGRGIERYFLEERHYSRPEKFPAFVHPLAFFEYDEKKILKKIKKFGWKMPPGVELNATNCYLNPFGDEVHIKKYHFHPYVLEIANFVREGIMTREEGLRHIPFEKDRKIVNLTKEKLGL